MSASSCELPCTLRIQISIRDPASFTKSADLRQHCFPKRGKKQNPPAVAISATELGQIVFWPTAVQGAGASRGTGVAARFSTANNTGWTEPRKGQFFGRGDRTGRRGRGSYPRGERHNSLPTLFPVRRRPSTQARLRQKRSRCRVDATPALTASKRT